MKRLLLSFVGAASLGTAFAVDPVKPDPGSIMDLKQTLVEIPHNVVLSLRNPPTREAAAATATDTLRTKVEGRTATLKFKIEKIEKDPHRAQNRDGYRVKAEDEHLRDGVTMYHVYLWVHFDLSETAKVAVLKKGSEISVTGKVTLASITAPNTPELHIDLSDAKVN
jgi:hypothetical protein